MNVTPSQFQLLGNALSLTQQNHLVIGQNIANVNTPGYQSKEIDFAEIQSRLAELESSGDFERANVVDKSGLVNRFDGNNVNIDAEVASLKKNALTYQSYMQFLSSQVATMRRAMTG